MAKTSAKGNSNDIEELLTCAVCLERLQSPGTLQCLHSFCKACIERLDVKIIESTPGVFCPMCYCYCKKKLIKSSFFIGNLLKITDDVPTEQKITPQCKACLTGDEATWKCVDCKMTLCNQCRMQHRLIPLLMSHKVVMLNDSSSHDAVDELVFCTEHTNELVRFNCVPCEKVLCRKCKIINHESHKTEDVEDALKRLVPSIKYDVHQMFTNVVSLKRHEGQLQQRIESTKRAYKNGRDQVTQDANAKKEEIEETMRALYTTLAVQYQAEINKLKTMKNKTRHKINVCTDLKRHADVSVNKARHVCLLSEIQSGLHSRVKFYAKPVKIDAVKVSQPLVKLAKEKPAKVSVLSFQTTS